MPPNQSEQVNGHLIGLLSVLQKSEKNKELELTATFPHSRDKVFSAFSNAGALQQWLSPSATITPKVDIFQFRKGGKFRICYAFTDQDQRFLNGTYQSIVEPEYLSFTWQWEHPDEHAGIQSLVVIHFDSISLHKTLLRLKHSQIDSIEMADRHYSGWVGSLENLKRYLNPLF